MRGTSPSNTRVWSDASEIQIGIYTKYYFCPKIPVFGCGLFFQLSWKAAGEGK